MPWFLSVAFVDVHAGIKAVTQIASATDPLAGLAPSARRAPPRVRIAVAAAVVLFVASLGVAAIISFMRSAGGEQSVDTQGLAPSTTAAGATSKPGSSSGGGSRVLVHVLGAVEHPGLVDLVPGSRVVDAVSAAGGFTADAEPGAVNLARPVVDGEQFLVPTKDTVGDTERPLGAVSGSGNSGGPTGGKVRLNATTVAELDTLPRIGPALAQRIIDWRDANGPFTSVDQLREIAGIGDAVFSGLKDRVIP